MALAYWFYLGWTDRLVDLAGQTPTTWTGRVFIFVTEVMGFVLLCMVVEGLHRLVQWAARYRIVRKGEQA